MVLHLDSDAGYLITPKARSRISGYFNYGNIYSKHTTPTIPILIDLFMLKEKFETRSSFCSRSIIAGLFHNYQTAVII